MSVSAAPSGHSGSGHGGHGHGVRWNVTRPQLASVGFLTVLALALGLVLPAQKVNLTLSADDVGGAVMPPGMIMTRDTPAQAMRDMAAVDSRDTSYSAPAAARGDRTLVPRLEGGVKVFDSRPR